MSSDSPPSDRNDAAALDADAQTGQNEMERIEKALEHRFARRELLARALCHSSFAHENPGTDSNERLEFLGDSVVGLVVAEALFRSKPEWDEGQLTRAMHALVEGRSLAALARSFDLGSAMKLGRTERQSGGAEKSSILADAMEALIGAYYLDAGLEAVAGFIERVFAEALAADAPQVERDPKTELQERLMASDGTFPTYRVMRDSEVEGDEERFEVEVVHDGRSLAMGAGRTKRAAERLAAARALEARDREMRDGDG